MTKNKYEHEAKLKKSFYLYKLLALEMSMDLVLEIQVTFLLFENSFDCKSRIRFYVD